MECHWKSSANRWKATVVGQRLIANLREDLESLKEFFHARQCRDDTVWFQFEFQTKNRASIWAVFRFFKNAFYSIRNINWKQVYSFIQVNNGVIRMYTGGEGTLFRSLKQVSLQLEKINTIYGGMLRKLRSNCAFGGNACRAEQNYSLCSINNFFCI